MDLSEIKEFTVLAETLSFSAAAKQLYISQSMLSKHIMSMEQEIDAKLFIRDNRSVRLTESGKIFYKRSREILKTYEQACEEVRDLENRVESVLRVGYLPVTTGDYFTQTCIAFHKLHPNVRVSVRALEVDDVIEKVLNGSLDIGNTIAPDGYLPALESTTFLKDRYGILCPKNHPLAKRESVKIAELKDLHMLIPSPESLPSANYATKHLFENADFTPELCEEMHDISAIEPFLLTGRGVALTMGFITKYLSGNYAFIPLEDACITPRSVACWKQSHESPVLLDFVECMRAAFDKSEQQ